jgi:hypothetical protein
MNLFIMDKLPVLENLYSRPLGDPADKCEGGSDFIHSLTHRTRSLGRDGDRQGSGRDHLQGIELKGPGKTVNEQKAFSFSKRMTVNRFTPKLNYIKQTA